MAPSDTVDPLKAALKEALAEALHEHRDLLRQIVEEALSDLALDADGPREAPAPPLVPAARAGFVATEGRA